MYRAFHDELEMGGWGAKLPKDSACHLVLLELEWLTWSLVHYGHIIFTPIFLSHLVLGSCKVDVNIYLSYLSRMLL
jgi:hypothetical protein